MEYGNEGLKELLARDPEAKRYYRALPPDWKVAMCSQPISTLEELKARTEDFLSVPVART